MINFIKNKSQRTKNVIWGSSTLIVSKILSALLGFVATGMIARYLSGEEFGLWALLISMPGLFGGLDLGFSNSLKNKLSLLFARKSGDEDKIYFFSVFYGFILLAIVLSTIIIIIKPFIPWTMLFNITQERIGQTGALLFNTNLFVIVLSIPFSIALTAGFFSYQESYLNSLFSFLVSVLTLSLLSFLIYLKSTFFCIALMFLLVGLFVYVLSFVIFLLKRKWNVISIKLKTMAAKLKELFASSVQFVLLQITAGIYFSVDPFVVSKISGLNSAGDYFVVKKICLLVLGIHAAALMAVWPTFTEALEKKDIVWAKKILNYLFLITLIVFIIFAITLYFIGSEFIYMWTGKAIHLKGPILLLGIWSLLFGIANCFSVFLNSFGNLKLQLLWSSLACVAVIPLSLYWGERYSIAGICWAQVVLVLPMAISNSVQSIKNIKRLSLEKLPRDN